MCFGPGPGILGLGWLCRCGWSALTGRVLGGQAVSLLIVLKACLCCVAVMVVVNMDLTMNISLKRRQPRILLHGDKY